MRASVGLVVGAALPTGAIAVDADASALELSVPFGLIAPPPASSPRDIPGLIMWCERSPDGSGWIDMLAGDRVGCPIQGGYSAYNYKAAVMYDRPIDGDERDMIVNYMDLLP